MAAVNYGMTLACKLDLANGVHQPNDAYMMALYVEDAGLNAFTNTYTPEKEVRGRGYVTGGKLLTGRKVELNGTRVEITWDNVRWANSTIRARCALIYNKSRGNRAMTILDLGEEGWSKNGNFDVLLPDAVIWFG